MAYKLEYYLKTFNILLSRRKQNIEKNKKINQKYDINNNSRKRY